MGYKAKRKHRLVGDKLQALLEKGKKSKKERVREIIFLPTIPLCKSNFQGIYNYRIGNGHMDHPTSCIMQDQSKISDKYSSSLFALHIIPFHCFILVDFKILSPFPNPEKPFQAPLQRHSFFSIAS